MKNLILCKKINTIFLSKKYKIYSRKNYIDKSFKNYTAVDEDLFSVSDYRQCDHDASCVEELLNKNFINQRHIKFLELWGERKYSNFVIGKQLIMEAKKIYKTFNYAKKVCKKYNLSGNIYVWPETLNLSIYNFLRENNQLPNNIKLFPLSKSYLKIYSSLKQVYYFLGLLIYPEIILLKCSNRRSMNSNFTSCIHMDDGLRGFQVQPYKLVTNTKTFKNKNIL